jgi:hypothetical protein
MVFNIALTDLNLKVQTLHQQQSTLQAFYLIRTSNKLTNNVKTKLLHIDVS